jgi:hypothetical protein
MIGTAALPGAAAPNPLKSKVFCFFFSKKKRFLPLLASLRPTGGTNSIP